MTDLGEGARQPLSVDSIGRPRRRVRVKNKRYLLYMLGIPVGIVAAFALLIYLLNQIPKNPHAWELDAFDLSKRLIVEIARDPDSVRFRDERLYRVSETEIAVCGEYNAKNGFGAYSGFNSYAVHFRKNQDHAVMLEYGVFYVMAPRFSEMRLYEGYNKASKYCNGNPARRQ